jgi:resuscitation-promoting factor RpfB
MSTPYPPPPEWRAKPTPIWKRWWFWAIVVVVVLIAAGLSADPNEGTDDAASSPTAANEPTSSPTASPTPVEVLVPDVEGQSVVAATRALEAEDLAVVVRTKPTDAARAGAVLQQSIEPGSTLAVGRAVVLTVAESLPTIPNVVGDKLAPAGRTLENRGFGVRVKRETSSQPKDTVIRQTPVGGTTARPGRTVLLVVAKPEPPPPAPSTSDGGSCTPGYSPCLPPASDYDCAGGTGDGPKYTGTVRVTGSDPYGLDSDGDGWGCE